MYRRLILLSALGALTACGGAASPPSIAALPTARVMPFTPAPLRVLPRARPTATAAPTAAPTSSPAPTPHPKPADTALAAPLEQYRAWMAEAQAAYPYSESIDRMWAVMLCESSGDASQVSGGYYGLFQYDAATWAGDWNPHRSSPILDARAQIFATAKAWHDGNQHWWSCYG